MNSLVGQGVPLISGQLLPLLPAESSRASAGCRHPCDGAAVARRSASPALCWPRSPSARRARRFALTMGARLTAGLFAARAVTNGRKPHWNRPSVGLPIPKTGAVVGQDTRVEWNPSCGARKPVPRIDTRANKLRCKDGTVHPATRSRTQPRRAGRAIRPHPRDPLPHGSPGPFGLLATARQGLDQFQRVAVGVGEEGDPQ